VRKENEGIRKHHLMENKGRDLGVMKVKKISKYFLSLEKGTSKKV